MHEEQIRTRKNAFLRKGLHKYAFSVLQYNIHSFYCQEKTILRSNASVICSVLRQK